MIKIINVHKKEFSCIGEIQKPEMVFYNLVEKAENSKPLYGVEVISIQDDYEEKEIACTFNCKNIAMDVINYLYENAIKLSHCSDVIRDIKDELKCFCIE